MDTMHLKKKQIDVITNTNKHHLAIDEWLEP